MEQAKIDADYMNSRFDKFFKLLQQGDYDQAAMDQVLRDLHKSFAMLSQIEQRYANLFISDIQSGEVKFDPTMTFRDYIAKYMRKAEDARIARIVRRLGCYEDLLRKLLDRKVNVSNYKDFGYFEELVCSVDRGKGQDTNQSQSENGIAIENDLSYDEDVDDEVVTRTTVSSRRLSHWYNKSNVLACMMNTGCFAYIEEKVFLDEPKYVERQDSGKMCLTAYAKEHEEECFLQFKMGADGKLHYIKLPESIADKEFHYTDYISEDILKQLGLVNEIAEQMLDVIRDMGFGDALRELMSNRVCNYSVNVVSACLRLHLPFPVSSTLVEAAALTLNIFVSSANAKAENRSYQVLLSTALWKFQDFIESRLFSVRQMGLSSPSIADKAERTIS